MIVCLNPFPYCSPHSKSKADLPKIKSPDPERYFGERDYSHCFKGWLLGHACIVMAIVSFSIFNAWTVREDEPHDEDEEQEMAVRKAKIVSKFCLNLSSSQQHAASYLNAMTLIIFSGIGLIAAWIGIYQIEVCIYFPYEALKMTSCFASTLSTRDRLSVN